MAIITADLVLVNGTVHTVDAQDTIAGAVAVADGRIVAVGSDRDVEQLVGDGTERVDLGGRSLVPGFGENHMHLLEASVDADWLDLTPERCRSIDDVVATVAQAAAAAEPGTWLLGWGFDDTRLAEGRYPTRHDLDRASTDHPVALRQVESMSWTANTRGLEAMGITATTPDPPGGELLRDGDGAPLGPMWDNCRVEFVFPTVPNPPFDRLLELFRATVRRLNALGITHVDDAGVVAPKQLRVYQALRDAGALTVRVSMNFYVLYGSDWDPEWMPQELFDSGLATGFGDDLLRIGPAVIGVDGGTGSRRSRLFEPYEGDPGDRGSWRVTPAFLEEFCTAAQARGFQIGAVAHGDEAISATLDAFERAMAAHPRPRNLRHRLEHAYLWNEELFARAAELGVVLSSQPPILRVFGPQQTSEAWGPDRSRWGFPYASVAKAGVVASGGSDCPLITPDPLLGMAALMDRRLWDDAGPQLAPEQALTLDQALRVYTHNVAYGDHAEDRWGSIRPGLLADLAVLSHDIRDASASDLAHVSVTETYLAGNQVFAA